MNRRLPVSDPVSPVAEFANNSDRTSTGLRVEILTNSATGSAPHRLPVSDPVSPVAEFAKNSVRTNTGLRVEILTNPAAGWKGGFT